MKHTTLVVSLLAASIARADSDASYRAELLRDAELRDNLVMATTDNRFTMDIQLHSQLRYTATFRQEPPAGEEDTALGFQIRRNKLKFAGNAGSEDLNYKIVFVSSGGGTSIILEEVWVRWKMGDGWQLLVGQAKLPFMQERLVSSSKQLAADRSRVARVFDQGYSQQAQISYTQDRWRIFGAVSDGLKSQNANFTMDPADIALTLRAETRFGEASWKALRDFISFPGSEFGVLVGGAIHYETGGETFGTVDQDLITATGDVTVKGDGWNAHASGVWRRVEPASGMDLTDYGLLAQGGVFLDDNNEVFARWDTVFPDEDRTSGNNDSFSTLTVGMNHYIFEKSHAATITGDVQYLLDPVEGGIIGGTTSLGQLADADDGQYVFRLQLEIVF